MTSYLEQFLQCLPMQPEHDYETKRGTPGISVQFPVKRKRGYLHCHPTELRTQFHRNAEQGVVITLVAVFLLFIVGAMAALSIDVVTFYTARSEAQLAADSGALAGARVLANSGMTSDVSGASTLDAEVLATTVAMQVASSNYVGGRTLVAGGRCPATEICISFNDGNTTNPLVTVQAQRTDLPTFFGRIWGSTQVTVSASATAEAYNPSGSYPTLGTVIPVAPMCVKPWLLPNIDPSNPSPNQAIFSRNITTGGPGIPLTTTLLGYTTPPPSVSNPNPPRLELACNPPNTARPGNCSTLPAPQAWQYYPGDPGDIGETGATAYFTPPTQALPSCTPALTTNYEKSIAGCIKTPIACNATVNIDMRNYGNARNTETENAVNCLTHATGGGGDKVDVSPQGPPFQFIAGDDNPVPGLAGNNVMVSDSLVTVPVFDSTGAVLTNPVQIVGFVQLFLSPTGTATPPSGHMRTTVINIAGCGVPSGATTQQPILGNGVSPVTVRLISPSNP
jgi:hypothetical protein